MATCPQCGGAGEMSYGSSSMPCSRCHGTGKISAREAKEEEDKRVRRLEAEEHHKHEAQARAHAYVAKMIVGSECSFQKHLAVLRWVGHPEFYEENVPWIGIEFKEEPPSTIVEGGGMIEDPDGMMQYGFGYPGLGDGSVNGNQYFGPVEDNHGMFLQLSNPEVRKHLKVW
mmetsp:Transcript_150401/g.273711  ORF Transcript_150401/g.273711 Transcript_150401/m.273711 type:complete len:171 (-) Transcript_150401:91-603(-)